MLQIGINSRLIKFLKKVGENYINYDNALIICSSYGKVRFVKYLLKKDLNFEKCLSNSLNESVRIGNNKIVKLLLKKSNNININYALLINDAKNNGFDDIVKTINKHLLNKN